MRTRGNSGGGGGSYRSKTFGDVTVTVLNDELFLVGGTVSGTITLSGWTTLATINDADYIPSTYVYGVLADGNRVSMQALFGPDGKIKTYASSGSLYNPYFSIIGKGTT